jgi:hypothetical protein
VENADRDAGDVELLGEPRDERLKHDVRLPARGLIRP